ncbi:hypothetical protein ACHAWF_007198 [Thalassiosira exigua]
MPHERRSSHAAGSADAGTEDSPGKMSLGPCRSVEEASVNTNIESVAMEEDADDGARSSDADKAANPDEAADAACPRRHREVTLGLTSEEERLFRLLSDAAAAYESGRVRVDRESQRESVSARGGFTKKESNLDEPSWLKPPPETDRIEIRVAGGWVRDKLLGQHSADVDVALDCMMGVQFARIVQGYMALLQEEEEEKEELEKGDADGDETMELDESKPAKRAKGGDRKKKQPKIGVIGANPSQSKHLETATMTVHGIDIDFVNLRAEEVYEHDSRIPTSETRMGTPLEDALRRDFTINSLFYNVRSRRVEDWTGRGLDDLLATRKIVTPVDPHVTFHDDPLRVLRAIRFSVRLDFDLDDRLKDAARSDRVHHSLHVKVSRERIGKEVEGMLSGRRARPGRALDVIADLHLAGSVFAFPGTFPGDHDYAGGPVRGEMLGETYECAARTECVERRRAAKAHRARGWEEGQRLLAALPELEGGHSEEREGMEARASSTAASSSSSSSSLLSSALDPRLLYLCVFILPFRDLTFPDKKGREVSVTSQMIKESLKFPVRDVQSVTKILSHVDEMVEVLSEVREGLERRRKEESGGCAERGASIGSPAPPSRLRMGLLLRSLKDHWVTCLVTAAAWEVRSRRRLREADAKEGSMVSEAVFHEAMAEAAEVSEVPVDLPSRALYRAVVRDLGLDGCWREKPHLNGRELLKELGLPRGPAVGTYLEEQTRWTLQNPRGTWDECLAHLRECRRRESEAEENRRAEDEPEEARCVMANGAGRPMREAGEGHFSKKLRAEP